MGRFIKKNQDDHKNSDSQSSDSQNFYFIDNIYATRIHLDGQLEYFVSWKGYPESENCWIPKYTVHHQNQTKSSKTVNSFSSSSPSENSNSPYQISNDPNHESSSSDVKEST